MNTFWIAVVLLAAGAVLAMLTSFRRRIDLAELGCVSEHWLSEQRSNDRHYSER